jgi:predicted O-methyltransferase YrrM
MTRGRRGRVLRTAAILAVRDPRELVERARRVAAFMGEGEGAPANAARLGYEPTAEHEQALHRAISVDWPCSVSREFDDVWNTLAQQLRAVERVAGEETLPPGIGQDADVALARLTFCAVTHLRPRVVVETGVARGLSTRAILTALRRNDFGHLWSIDLPPLAHGWGAEKALRIDESLARRWTFVRGASRRRLPDVVARTNGIDVFVHDSLHTESNMTAEFNAVWPALVQGGVLFADDIGGNSAFRKFADKVEATVVIGREENKSTLFGALVKPRF